MKLSNGLIGLIVGIAAFAILYLMAGPAPAGASGFQAGEAMGRLAGPAIVLGVVVWAVLRYGLKRRA
ncbi:MAG TPA: hypothetical protein VHL56_00325 [Candidatus Limnocylindrales bacterium]|nr:hypothetical protein [Candidatus Limnocylindrales bacterium]